MSENSGKKFVEVATQKNKIKWMGKHVLTHSLNSAFYYLLFFLTFISAYILFGLNVPNNIGFTGTMKIENIDGTKCCYKISNSLTLSSPGGRVLSTIVFKDWLYLVF